MISEQQEPFSPMGEGAPKGRMRGPSLARQEVAPHQFGQMTYGRATKAEQVVEIDCAAVSHGLTSSPPRGEGKQSGTSKKREIASC